MFRVNSSIASYLLMAAFIAKGYVNLLNLFQLATSLNFCILDQPWRKKSDKEKQFFSLTQSKKGKREREGQRRGRAEISTARGKGRGRDRLSMWRENFEVEDREEER